MPFFSKRQSGSKVDTHLQIRNRVFFMKVRCAEKQANNMSLVNLKDELCTLLVAGFFFESMLRSEQFLQVAAKVLQVLREYLQVCVNNLY